MKLLLAFLSVFLLESTSSFCLSPRRTNQVSLTMVGPGWDNGSYLDGLGDDDQTNAEQDYQQFKETRAAFLKRQEERLNSKAGQEFMQQQREEQVGDGDFSTFDQTDESQFGRQPSRFQNMMEQTKGRMEGGGRGQRPPGLDWMRGPPGLEQKLAIPLDYDEDDEDNDE
jgi:hypothetical protein